MTAPALEPVNACPCGGSDLMPSDFALRLHGMRFGLRRCVRCGRRLLDPRPSQSGIAGTYDADYYGAGPSKFVGPVEAFVEHFRGRRARAADRLIAELPRAASRNRRVLDIGCGSGQFLARLAARGYECHGTELSEETGRRAAAVPGIRLHVGTIARDTYAVESFELISIWHVLEHLPDPDQVLRYCRDWLAPGGFLMIAVPNISSWQALTFRDAWFHLDPPRHLYHFDPASLRTILDAAGFRTLRIGHLSWEQNLYGYLQSALNAFGFPRDQLYELLKGNRRATIPLGQMFQAALATALLPPAVIATAAEAAFGRGGTIECLATRIGDPPAS